MTCSSCNYTIWEWKKAELYLDLFQYLSLHNLFHLVNEKLHEKANMCTSQGQEEPKITWSTDFHVPEY